MKQWLAILPLLWSTALHAALPEKQEHEFRTWTSTDGRTLRAELLEFSDQQVKVKREKDMTIFEIPLENLAPADRKLVLGMVRERNRNNGLTQGSFASLITGQFSPGKSKDGLNFQLFGSPEWDGTKRYPLVVWLHGAGQSGKDNTSQLAGHPKQWFVREAQENKPCFGLAPQCFDRDVGWKGQPAEDVVALIKNLEDELPIDEARIYLTGSSMGGSGVWYMLAQWPEMFACGIPLCGVGDPKTAGILRTIPIWAFHGDKDDQVPIERSRVIVEAIKALNGKVLLTELAGEGHLITSTVYDKQPLAEWMFLQRKSSATPAP